MEVAVVEAMVADAQAKVKPGYTVQIANRSRESVQVEIREADGFLCWRAWSCETDFEYDLTYNLGRYTN